ncbi:MAG TPA: ABC transporter permease [Trebonia sp.]|jgi:peptide/nickel transport system permease protein
MIVYLLRRLVQAIVVVLLVSVIVFVLLHLLPGGPARAILGQTATQAQVAAFNQAQGYDRPIPVQYLSYLGQLLHGQLGYSYQRNENVGTLLAERIPKTLLLTVAGTIVALVIAIPLGLLQAVRRNRPVDYVLTAVTFVLYAMPLFFLGLLLIIGFSQDLRWFPSQAPQSDSLLAVLSQPAALVLPVATLALVTIAAFSRYVRSAVLDNLSEDYVRTARAKGALEGRVLFRHVTRNALVPVVTLLGVYIPYLFSGSLVVEAIFNYPGMGLLFWNAAQTRDYPVLLGVALVVSVATVVGSLLVDIAYVFLDPRVRYVSA